MNLKETFPRASKSFIEANQPLCVAEANKNSVAVRTGAGKGIRGRMNKTEAEFALQLEAMKRAGEILRWEFQGITLRWFDMRYTPDFVVFGARQNLASFVTFIEVKGPHIHYRQQALARFKGARGFWPEFTFEMHQRGKDGQWRQII